LGERDIRGEEKNRTVSADQIQFKKMKTIEKEKLQGKGVGNGTTTKSVGTTKEGNL